MFTVALSGCRRGFEPIPALKEELYSQETVADERTGVKSACLDIVYDPQVANGGGGGVGGVGKWR